MMVLRGFKKKQSIWKGFKSMEQDLEGFDRDWKIVYEKVREWDGEN